MSDDWTPAPGQDPREIDAEYSSEEILSVWESQDPREEGDGATTGMGLSSESAAGEDLPVDADPDQGHR